MSTKKNIIVDLSALKFNQISIVTLLLLGFILNQPYLPAIVAAVLIVGSIEQHLALFKQVYRFIFVPLGLLKPNLVEESPMPHNFAQLLGGVMLALASILLFQDSVAIGWIFTWLVILLALANIVFGFCAGCFLYFQLGKLKVPGFYIQETIKD